MELTTLHYVVPSRGRPNQALRLIEAFARLRGSERTALTLALDLDDPALPDYYETVHEARLNRHDFVTVTTGPRLRMGGTLNAIATLLARDPGVHALGFMGDDHLPVTLAWDLRYLAALNDGGQVVYGNDGIQGAALPTQVALRADIVRALGYMAPPELVHLYLDNFWKDLGEQLYGLRYLPDVVVRHLHPIANLALWDATYSEANANVEDADRYRAYVDRGGLVADALKVQEYERSHAAC